MPIILADNAGFCFGVKRAVEEALKAKEKYNKRIYTLGPLIHNNDAINYLKENNIYPIELDDIKTLNADDVLIIRSHGISEELYEMLKIKGLKLIDATCPYVTIIHKRVNKFFNEGYSIIIVGDKNHPEVIGINGWCNNSAFVSKQGEGLENIPLKVCVVSQTTEKQDNWEKVLSIISKKSKEIIAFNTICSATEIKQKTADELSKHVDMMIVVGGRHSSNTTKLYDICSNNCRTIHIENASEIPDEIINLNKHNKIGVTAGASTPDWIIKEAILKMNSNETMEMNEQLEFMNKNDVPVFVGQMIKGEVISVNDNEVFVNIGYKVDAILPKEEITKDPTVNLLEKFKTGDSVEAKIISRRNDDGYVVLSRIVVERDEAFKALKEAKENETSVNIVIKEAVKGGLVGSYNGIRIFIPASHVELYHVDNLEDYINKEFEIKIIEFAQERRNTKIVGSRREILKIEKNKIEEKAWETIKLDDVLEGQVRRLTDFGAFVNVNGIDGLLHVSEISWGRVAKPSDALKIGDTVTVKVIGVDKENKKLSLSIKALIEDPWNNVDIKYPVDTIVLGKVVRFANFGAFVELEPGVDALVHISQISHKRINKPSDVLSIGQQVKAKILDVNKETKKIALSIKEADEL